MSKAPSITLLKSGLFFYRILHFWLLKINLKDAALTKKLVCRHWREQRKFLNVNVFTSSCLNTSKNSSTYTYTAYTARLIPPKIEDWSKFVKKNNSQWSQKITVQIGPKIPTTTINTFEIPANSPKNRVGGINHTACTFLR